MHQHITPSTTAAIEDLTDHVNDVHTLCVERMQLHAIAGGIMCLAIGLLSVVSGKYLHLSAQLGM